MLHCHMPSLDIFRLPYSNHSTACSNLPSGLFLIILHMTTTTHISATMPHYPMSQHLWLLPYCNTLYHHPLCHILALTRHFRMSPSFCCTNSFHTTHYINPLFLCTFVSSWAVTVSPSQAWHPPRTLSNFPGFCGYRLLNSSTACKRSTNVVCSQVNKWCPVHRMEYCNWGQ